MLGAGLRIAGVVKPQFRLLMVVSAALSFPSGSRSMAAGVIRVDLGCFRERSSLSAGQRGNRSGLILEPVVQSPVRARPHSDPPGEVQSTWLCVTPGGVKLRNITFSLPAEMIRGARIYAAERDTTINSVVRDLLEEALSRENRARVAADRLLAIAERGPYFTSDLREIRREELHERR